MIKFEEALMTVVNSVTSVNETESVSYLDSLGRALAEDVFSDINMPPFDKSAMDGYACRKQDIHNELKVIELIQAGKVPEKTVGCNECSKIMTGAMIPNGADCVLMVEHTEETKEGYIKFTKESTNLNICYLAEDIKKDEKVLSAGIEIKPQHIAVMASVGYTNAKVYKKPKVGIISTGDEIVEPDCLPNKSQIRNSNGSQLIAQVLRAGAIPNYLGIAEDSKDATLATITSALRNNDIVLLTGGVSMGDYDFVPEIMETAGVAIKFRNIAVQPGKPTIFGTFSTNKFIFGLPGNPVSSYTQFELLVRPLIRKLMNIKDEQLLLKLPMGADYQRKKSVRKSFLPVCIKEDGNVYPVDYHGSAHIHSYVNANALISIEIGCSTLKKGEIVDVRQV